MSGFAIPTNAPAGPPPEVIEAFTTAALTALRELARIEAFPDDASPAGAAMAAGALSAAVRLLRPAAGSLSLVLPVDTASRLAARYLPEGTPLTDALIDDVAGELANVIAGQAKTILKGTPFHFALSTPLVTRTASGAPSVAAGEALMASLDSELGRVLLFVHLPECPGA